MNAGEILTKARLTLSDKGTGTSRRWSDARLLSLLNDALADIALTTRVFSASGYLELEQNIRIYDLSDFAIKIQRVEYLNKPLQLLSHREMDRMYGTDWQDISAETPLAIVYDLQRAAEIVVYPVPKLGNLNVVESNSDYGIITDLHYDDVQLEIISDDTSFGGVSEPNLANYLKIYYTKIPKKLEVDVDDYASAAEIEHSTQKLLREPLDAVVNRTLLSILAHYVAGKAFRDNMDTANVQLGNQELRLYYEGKSMSAGEKMSGNVQRTVTSSYNPLGY